MEPLIAALKDRDKDVRKAAAQALGKIGDPRAVEPLIPALSDKDNDVRSVTAEALGNIGAQLQDATLRTRVVEQLIEALKESGVRHKAAVALGKIGDTRAVGPLIASLKDGFWYRQSPEEVEALAQIGIPAVKPLVVALKDSNQQVRCLAAEALCKISDAHAIEPPIARLEDIVEPLIDLLEDDYGERRRASAKNLVKLYQSGELDMRLKQRILIYKQKMSERHIDKKYEGSCDTSGGHTDIGIGIEL
jgi:HEAT repeat protein